MSEVEDLKQSNAKMYDTIIAQGGQIEYFEKEITRIKALLEKEFRQFRDSDTVERIWKKFKADNKL